MLPKRETPTELLRLSALAGVMTGAWNFSGPVSCFASRKFRFDQNPKPTATGRATKLNEVMRE